ncbi:MAG: ComEA family DNA-binding protein [Candidatus Binatia bacterium]
MKSWKTYLLVSSFTAGLTGVSGAWGQSAPKQALPATSPVPVTSPSTAPTEAKPIAAKININTADETTLMSVKGIGKSKAKAIIAHRDQHGPFKTVAELTKVKGIKEKSLKKFQDQITVE